MHVLKYLTGEGGGEDENYNIKATLTGNNKSNYKLNVHIHHYFHSQGDSKTDYNYNNLSVLSFDETLNVFYSIKDGIYNNFTLFDPKNMDNLRSCLNLISKKFYTLIPLTLERGLANFQTEKPDKYQDLNSKMLHCKIQLSNLDSFLDK